MIRNIFVVVVLTLQCGCMNAYRQSVGADRIEAVERVFLADYGSGWQATLEALKSSRLDISNRESGTIQTRWTDNTAEKNLDESSIGGIAFLKAQYRFKVNVAKGFYNGQTSVRVAIRKEQMVQRDVLDGWRPVETDLIEERSLIYRVGRLISIHMKLAKLEDAKIKKEAESTKF